LKEFVVVDKRRLNKAPTPTQSLGVDELSLLPLCGVPSRRAVVALTAASIKKGSQILVLNAHHGSGALVLQELVAKGLEPIAHIPPLVDVGSLPWTEKDRATSLQGDVLPLISRMESSSLDAVIDTVGGHEVWEECRRVLRDNGSVSLVIILLPHLLTIIPVCYPRRRISNYPTIHIANLEIESSLTSKYLYPK
jgi:D-arabinose 1-dehydrogenase-like Zn-dependent alcohol dehydrogenase